MPPFSSRWTVVAVALILCLAAGLSLYWKGRLEGAARERPKLDAARSQAAVSALEARGARQGLERAAAAADVAAGATGSLADLSRHAQTSEDARAPLDPDRSRRLHAHDVRLCQWSPELAGCSSAGDAAPGATPVRPPPPSGRAHSGRP